MKQKLHLPVLFCLLLAATFGKSNAQTDILQGGNLESETGWSVTYLNTPGGTEPTATWNYTTDAPAAGLGGNLHVTGSTTAGNSQYCIYQEVKLSKDSIYTFDGAFKLVTMEQAWLEAYIGVKPTDGNDYGGGEGTLLGGAGSWAANTSEDSTFAEHAADYKTYAPDTSGTYFLVVKMGSTSWDGSSQSFELMLDELSLIKTLKPKPDFEAKAGGLITGGEMEDLSKWDTSYLNTPSGFEPTATWNNTIGAPIAGLGGNLHVTGTSNNNNVQYAIYQEVSLSADSMYAFDGAFKGISINQSWCEVFIGSRPTVGNDYGGGQFLIGKFGGWDPPTQNDGIFSLHANQYNKFAPDSTGPYYFVLKMGSTSWDGSDKTFEFLMDEISLKGERVKPVAKFSSNVSSGFTPLEVNFKDESAFATSWSWDFGDGSPASTDQNPTHTYASSGLYSVSLTATNELGDSTIEKVDYITVTSEPLPVDGKLSGGNMEDAGPWSVTVLNTASGSEPTAVWNYTTQKPGLGDGGCLYISAPAGSNTRQFAIYQELNLSKDSVYTFNGAFKDISTALDQAWCEVFIGNMPIDGLDYGNDNGTRIAEFNGWNDACKPFDVDGSFMKDGCHKGGFVPEASGTYYFVLKFGTNSGIAFDVLIDELSLIETRTKPYTAFSADNPVGFSPLTVQFKDESHFANSWSWNFGDGSAVSTDQNPQHVYANTGVYTVSLTATNEKGDSTLTKTEYVKANEKPELPKGEKLYGGNMEDPNLWNITNLDTDGHETVTWNSTNDTLMYGEGGNLYLKGPKDAKQSQFCMWQAVEMHKDSVYHYDAAIKAIENPTNAWIEVFIGTVAPVDGNDYGADSIKVAVFSTWASCNAANVDGTIQNDACVDVAAFQPEETGTYYFVIKMGCQGGGSLEVAIDEVTMMESTFIPAPEADFFADITEGLAPLTVFFTDLSKNATSWSWDFGDGNTSTDQSPNHTYNTPGLYTVTMVAIAGQLSDTLEVSDLITVGTNSIEEVQRGDFTAYPNPSEGLIHISLSEQVMGELLVTDLAGKLIYQRQLLNESDIQVEISEKGMFILQIRSDSFNSTRKIIIK